MHEQRPNENKELTTSLEKMKGIFLPIQTVVHTTRPPKKDQQRARGGQGVGLIIKYVCGPSMGLVRECAALGGRQAANGEILINRLATEPKLLEQF